MSTGHLIKVDETLVRKQVENGISLGVSTIRFTPKESSLRPIMNTNKNLFGQNLKAKLHNSFAALTYLVSISELSCGAAVFGIGDIQNRLARFKSHWREDGSRLYAVKTDIKRCYDSILHDRLSIVIDRFLHENKHINHLVISFYRKKTGLRTKIVRCVERVCFTDSRIERVEYPTSVYSKMVDLPSVVFSFRQLRLALNRNITQSYLKIGTCYYKQSIGIAHGSILSSLLCNLYYGYLEKDFLEETLHAFPAELLMRQVDDYLFLTPSREHACQFMQVLFERGIREYGSKCGLSKSVCNFDIAWRHMSDNIKVIRPNELISWCGILIDTHHLHVVVDKDRYIKQTFSSLSRPSDKHFGVSMKNKLLTTICSRARLIYFDKKINDRSLIIKNIKNIFALAAGRADLYCSHLVSALHGRTNINFIRKCAKNCAFVLYARLARRNSLPSKLTIRELVKMSESAFQRVLQKWEFPCQP